MSKTKGLLLAVAAAAMAFTFSCSSDDEGSGGGTMTHEGQKYKTVTIGSQTWMAENLNGGGYCYSGEQDLCAEYGALYSWEAAMTVCPDGWHLPSFDEWMELVDYAGGSDVAGKKLKSKKGWVGEPLNPCSGNCNGTDDYGFSALPGGEFGMSSYGMGAYGKWWTSGSFGSQRADAIEIESGNGVSSLFADKSYYFFVRCVKN